MNKKGISPLIATILLIGIVVIIASMVVLWSKELFKSTMTKEESAEAEMICKTEIKFNINNTIATEEGTEITIINDANTQIENFVAKVYLDTGEIRLVKGIVAVNTLGAYDTKSYKIKYGGTATKIELIPEIKLKSGTTTVCERVIEETNVSS